MTHAYHDLPSLARGSALESHSLQRITWTTTDPDRAILVRDALTNIIERGQMQARWTVHIVAHNDGNDVVLERPLPENVETPLARASRLVSEQQDATPGNVERPT